MNLIYVIIAGNHFDIFDCVCAFTDKNKANILLDKIIEYENSRPESHVTDWEKKHPAGAGYARRDYYEIIEVPLIQTPNAQDQRAAYAAPLHPLVGQPVRDGVNK